MGFPRSQGFMRHAFSEYRRIILPGELDKKKLVRPPETVLSYILNIQLGSTSFPRFFSTEERAGASLRQRKAIGTRLSLKQKILIKFLT